MTRPHFGSIVVCSLMFLSIGLRPVGAQSTKAKAKAVSMEETAADSIVLRDGKTLLGQVILPSPPNSLHVIVRRDWASVTIPDWYGRWQAAERPRTAESLRQRRDRLTAWRRERVIAPGGTDRIAAWLDREIAKPADTAAASPLMVAKLARTDVKAITKRSRPTARVMRLGWTLGFPDVETIPLIELKDAIAARGLAVTGDEPVALDALLPPQVESADRWSLRRAATEVLYDDGLRLVRYGGMVHTESTTGRPPDPTQAVGLIGEAVKELLGDVPVDPLPGKLNEIAARGRVGAVVTRLDVAEDLSSVRVESTLYVLLTDGRRLRAISRSATVRNGEVPPIEAAAVGDDPQVKSAFGVIEALGLGTVSAEMRAKSLAVGATTKRALDLARSALQGELSSLALPLAL